MCRMHSLAVVSRTTRVSVEQAKALGMSPESVRRLRTIGEISKEAQAAADKAGLGDNKGALVKIGKAKTPKAQLEKVRELVKAREAPPRRGRWLEKKQVKRLNQAFKKQNHSSGSGGPPLFAPG